MVVARCPRLPRTAPDYSTMVPECDAELGGAGGPDVSRRESLALAETELASDLRRTNRLTLELSGHINREAIDWSA